MRSREGEPRRDQRGCAPRPADGHIAKPWRTGIDRHAARHRREFRRDWWHIDFIHGFDGVELAAGDAYGDAKFKNTDEQRPS